MATSLSTTNAAIGKSAVADSFINNTQTMSPTKSNVNTDLAESNPTEEILEEILDENKSAAERSVSDAAKSHGRRSNCSGTSSISNLSLEEEEALLNKIDPEVDPKYEQLSEDLLLAGSTDDEVDQGVVERSLRTTLPMETIEQVSKPEVANNVAFVSSFEAIRYNDMVDVTKEFEKLTQSKDVSAEVVDEIFEKLVDEIIKPETENVTPHSSKIETALGDKDNEMNIDIPPNCGMLNTEPEAQLIKENIEHVSSVNEMMEVDQEIDDGTGETNDTLESPKNYQVTEDSDQDQINTFSPLDTAEINESQHVNKISDAVQNDDITNETDCVTAKAMEINEQNQTESINGNEETTEKNEVVNVRDLLGNGCCAEEALTAELAPQDNQDEFAEIIEEINETESKTAGSYGAEEASCVDLAPQNDQPQDEIAQIFEEINKPESKFVDSSDAEKASNVDLALQSDQSQDEFEETVEEINKTENCSAEEASNADLVQQNDQSQDEIAEIFEEINKTEVDNKLLKEISDTKDTPSVANSSLSLLATQQNDNESTAINIECADVPETNPIEITAGETENEDVSEPMSHENANSVEVAVVDKHDDINIDTPSICEMSTTEAEASVSQPTNESDENIPSADETKINDQQSNDVIDKANVTLESSTIHQITDVSGPFNTSAPLDPAEVNVSKDVIAILDEDEDEDEDMSNTIETDCIIVKAPEISELNQENSVHENEETIEPFEQVENEAANTIDLSMNDCGIEDTSNVDLALQNGQSQVEIADIIDKVNKTETEIADGEHLEEISNSNDAQSVANNSLSSSDIQQSDNELAEVNAEHTDVFEVKVVENEIPVSEAKDKDDSQLISPETAENIHLGEDSISLNISTSTEAKGICSMSSVKVRKIEESTNTFGFLVIQFQIRLTKTMITWNQMILDLTKMLKNATLLKMKLVMMIRW